ncbi:unnamed protein product [Fraxinus pennsylvanica]|uniref:Protein kinase domain-containing protein n=1 Tax=Fraxinus pennsylvanica TaxID=56036 RepID=A0AAD1Z4F9_9LAMI|nr:unnamed protein product [Fraxinus pennsylvanica]
MYGEIEEGPLGFDKRTRKSKGFPFFVYKTDEGAKALLLEPMKSIDGHQVIKCEISTMKLIRHPNVIRMYEVTVSKTKMYIVMEFVTGSELFDKIEDKSLIRQGKQDG